MTRSYEFAELKLTRRVGMIWWGAFLVAASGTGCAGMLVWVMANGMPNIGSGRTWIPIILGFVAATASATVGIALIALSRYGPDRTFLAREPRRPPEQPRSDPSWK